MNGSGNNPYSHTKNRVSNLKYRHEGNVWRIEAALSYTDSSSDKRDTDRGYFNTTPAQIANLIIRDDEARLGRNHPHPLHCDDAHRRGRGPV
jgi:hypothetical protein